jgi:hypothetical protein
MKERLFLNRIALHAADVAPRHEEAAASVEANFANAHRPVGDGTLVPAGVAAQSIAVEWLDELGRGFACALG